MAEKEFNDDGVLGAAKRRAEVDLRDQFAMAALTGLLIKGMVGLAAVKEAYAIASQMMAERER